jgi:hypothetical protein
VSNDYTLARDLDRQFGDMAVLVARDQQNSADDNLDALAVLFAIARAAERDPNAALNSGCKIRQATKNEPPELAARSVKQGGVKVQEDGLTPPLMIEKP